MPQNPPTGDTEAILTGNPVSQIPADRAEGVLSLLKLTPHDQPSSMSDLIGQHHQIRLANAQMYAAQAKDFLHKQLMVQQGIDPENGMRFDDRDYKGEGKDALAARYDANYKASWENYKKTAGVDQNTKGALAKAEQILNHILGGGAMQSAPGAPSDQGRPGGMAPPPATGLSGNAGGPSQVEAAAPAATPSISPPPRPTDVSANPLAAPMIEANTQFEQGQQRRTAEDQRAFQVQHAQWKAEADKLFEPGSREYKWYAATGKLPPVARLQSKLYKDPTTGDIKMGSFDPISGTIAGQDGQVVDNAQPASPADLATHTVNLMTPDGPRMMFRAGNKVYDNAGNLQDGELVPFIRGMVPTTTDREVMGFDEQGNPTKYLLRSTRTINMGPTPSPMASGAPTPAAGGAAGGAGQAVPPATTPKGRMSAPPKPQGAGAAGTGGAQSGGKGKVFPAGQFMQFSKSATGVDQARNSLVGDHIEKGQVGGLAKDLDIFKDQSAVARIGEYLQLVHNLTAREGDSFAKSDDVVGAVKWFAGMPQAVIGLQQGALRDKYNQLTTDDKKFVADYFRAMGTMGGMRASTGMPGYQWSFTNMYNEMPTPGKVTDYDDAIRRLMNYVQETNVVSKRNPMVPKVDVEDAEKQVRGTSSGTSKGGMTPPPSTGGSGTVRFTDNGKVYNIPANMVDEFRKDHPNAQ